MSTTTSDKVTGWRTPTWKTVAVVILLGIVVLGTMVYFTLRLMRGSRSSAMPRQHFAAGSIEPTMAVLETGVSAEEASAKQAREAWERSMNLSQEDQSRRSAEAQQQGTPDAQPRTVQDRPSIDLMQDVAAAEAAQVVGAQVSRVERRNDGSVRVETAQPDAPGSYLTLYERELIASQQAGVDPKTPTDAAEKDSREEMVLFDVPAPSVAAPESRRQGSSAQPAGPRMPVNILPRLTVPIHCRFDGSFIAVGAGSDTQQRITVTVDQDVWARNRLQLPKGAKLIGMTGGVRDLDMVDVHFEAIQFQDLTEVPITGQAYQAYSDDTPRNTLIRGVKGEYEEPDIPKQLAPIFLAALQGAAKSNLSRLAANGVQIGGSLGGGAVQVTTSDRDRFYGAVEGSVDKLVEWMMERLRRYRPRVRIDAGQPLIVLLDQHVDLSKRTLMGHADPLQQAAITPTQDAESTADSEATAHPTPGSAPAPSNAEPTREGIMQALSSATPEQIQMLMRLSQQAGQVSPAANPAKPGTR